MSILTCIRPKGLALSAKIAYNKNGILLFDISYYEKGIPDVKITDIRIRKTFDNADRLKALVSITVDGCLAIHDIRVIQGEDRLFVAMPNRKDESGSYRDIVHPIQAKLRQEFERLSLKAYQNYIDLFKDNDDISN